ncbi:MAG: hypothetical protein LH468_07605 [Nocardioides sp.]|nr:hypothetical protein [Nocardioides sp.]
MVGVSSAMLPLGIVFSQSLLRSEVFAVLAAFVAINTMMYGALAVAKMLPKVYPSDWTTSRNRRVESRGIHPLDKAGTETDADDKADTEADTGDDAEVDAEASELRWHVPRVPMS